MLLVALLACPPKPAPVPAAPVADGFRVPAEAYGWYLRGLVAEAHHDDAEADRAMGWMVRLDRSSSAAWVELGRHHRRARRPEDALDAFLRALDIDPNDRGALDGAAWAWGRLGHAREARELLDRAAAQGTPLWAEEVAHAHGLGDAVAANERLTAWSTRPVGPDETLHRAAWALRLGRADLAFTDLLPLVGHPAQPDAPALFVQAVVESGSCAVALRALDDLGVALTAWAAVPLVLEAACAAVPSP